MKSRGPSQSLGLVSAINNGKDGSAVNPAGVMREFFNTFLEGSAQVLLLISILVTVIANVGILVSIYNSVVYRQREIAIFRALGATRRKIVGIICLEAGLIGLLGSVAGVVAGHLIGAAGSVYMQQLMGQGIQIGWRWDGMRGFYILLAVGLALLAGLVPALKAYRTSVAVNLAG